MKPEQISTINAIVERLDDQRRCNCQSATHDEGCIIPMLLDLHRQANETRHTITIFKLDKEEAVAKQLAEEELVAIFGPHTDHATEITHHTLKERYLDRGLIGYFIRIEANLTDEEVAEIHNRQLMRQRKLLANIGQVSIDNVDIGHTFKEFI